MTKRKQDVVRFSGNRYVIWARCFGEKGQALKI